MIGRTLTKLTLIALMAGVFVAVGGPSGQVPMASAVANGRDFDPGNIISDAAFYDGGSMSAQAVQSFLNAKVPNCQSGYTCLKDYRQNTPSMAANAYCTAMTGQSNESAASIIARVGQACGISQRVLLVLLQKEQSLVTHTWPSQYRFDKATGFACPDTAPCDPAFSGFFYQIYYAARQFQRYAMEPTRYNYQAGRVNQILFHPNAACGTAPVYIANKATAGLYNYTPYQPNAAALSNLYGTGDGCSSYGNRNFWRLYTDWFGLPSVGSNLVRTVDNATVYLVSGDNKYPVPSIAVLTALAPLGQVGYVSQQYLDGFTTGTMTGGAYRSESGSIFILDRGYRLEFQSCAQLVDFGYACDPSGYVQLTDAQVSAFAAGPVVTNLVGTVSGARYFVDDGAKHEILDEASQTAAGITGPITVLNDDTIAPIPVGAPVTRPDVFASVRGSSNYILIAPTGRYSVPAAAATSIGASTRSAGALSPASVALIGTDLGQLGTSVKDSTGTLSVLTATGRYHVTGGGTTATAPTLSDQVLSTYPVLGELAEGSFIIGPSGGTVYIVMPTDIRPIASWGALLALTPDGNVSITTVDASVIASMPHGPVALTAGTLVRSPQDATVFFINGVTSRIAFSNFVYPSEAGFLGFSFTTQDRILGYPMEPTVMTFAYMCGTDKYVAAGGSLHLVPSALTPAYPQTTVPLDRFTCGSMKIGKPATQFIRTPDGSIYLLANGMKYPVSSMARLMELGGSVGWLDVHPWFAAEYPTGPLA